MSPSACAVARRLSWRVLAGMGSVVPTCGTAYRHRLRVFEFDDLTMIIGTDAAARMLEVDVARAEGVEFIVHAVAAREKFLR